MYLGGQKLFAQYPAIELEIENLCIFLSVALFFIFTLCCAIFFVSVLTTHCVHFGFFFPSESVRLLFFVPCIFNLILRLSEFYDSIRFSISLKYINFCCCLGKCSASFLFFSSQLLHVNMSRFILRRLFFPCVHFLMNKKNIQKIGFQLFLKS